MNAGGAAERHSGFGAAGYWVAVVIAVVSFGRSLPIAPGANLVIWAGHKELNILVGSHDDSMSRLDQDRVARIRQAGYLHDSLINDNLSIPARFDSYAELCPSDSYRSCRAVNAVGVGSSAQMIYPHPHTPNGNPQQFAQRAGITVILYYHQGTRLYDDHTAIAQFNGNATPGAGVDFITGFDHDSSGNI
jgi:hypothetical protein